MSIIFTVGKKASEIVSSTSSPLPKVQRAHARLGKNLSMSYEPSENVIVWNVNLGSDHFSLAYCKDTHTFWNNDEQIQLHKTSKEDIQEYTFSIMNHKGVLSILTNVNQNTPIYKLCIDGNEIRCLRSELSISEKK
ncbi:uncharacterized protein Smp_203720 [Schistosoma mansoni]|uniref:Bulb-type lectin domain-containing protein n=1 Tax=Schistosoma mansoni TaxID=6183 RepID=G4VPP9_SCHMA|nr:uncharacterized protein Smp_203720 [Schistosoma mansoni]|eukprot:XP_018654992.1 uncharacterized protein Smp_203720 [Schistosoma mansoni]